MTDEELEAIEKRRAMMGTEDEYPIETREDMDALIAEVKRLKPQPKAETYDAFKCHACDLVFIHTEDYAQGDQKCVSCGSAYTEIIATGPIWYPQQNTIGQT